MKHSTWGKRALAAAGVAALTLPALAGTATAADFDPTTVTTTGGTIHITKYAFNGTGNTATGTNADTAPQGATPLAGVVFKATPVCSGDGATPINLGTVDGWKTIAPVKTTDEMDDNHLAKCTGNAGVPSAATVADGTTSITVTSNTLYYVEEVSAPATVTDKADPFLVTMPFVKDDGSNVNDVYVYPKNGTADAPSKTIVTEGDNATKLGDVASANDYVVWSMEATLPDYYGDGNKFIEVWFEDTLPAGLTNPEVLSVTVGTDTLATTDYEVTGAVKVALTATGLAKAQPGEKMVVTLKTKVGATASGAIVNNFTSHTKSNDPNDPGTDNPTDPTPGDETLGGGSVVNRGTFTISKTDAKTGAKLAGAKFEICEAADGADSQECKDTNRLAPLTADGTAAATTELLTDANGNASATLLIGSGKDGVAPTTKRFCVVETAAPDGYVRDTAAKCFTLNAADTTAKSVDVTNVKASQWIPGLPVTGAAGLMLLTLGGASLAAIAVGSAVLVRRRQH